MRSLEILNGGIMESGMSSSRPSLPVFHCSNIPLSEQCHWLLSRRADFWLACGGASIGLLAAMLLILLRGDRELDAIDFVLSEFHMGATYDAILRRRLWHHRQFDVLLIPLVVLALTYAFSLGGQTVLLTSIAMYAAVWHRGRQSLGVARFYQRGMGGPVSRTHEVLFRGAIYLPMLAAVLAYTHLAPEEYEGQPYVALSVGAEIASTVGLGALLWLIAYFVWTLRESRVDSSDVNARQNCDRHPSRRVVGGARPWRRLRQRLRARRVQCFIFIGSRRASRSAISLFHVRHGSAPRGIFR